MRSGVTLIELVVVMAIMAVLAGISAPGIHRLTLRHRLTADAEAIVRAHRVARNLAMRQAEPAVPLGSIAPHYGVVIESGPEGYAVVVVAGTDIATAAPMCSSVTAEPLHRWVLGRSSRVQRSVGASTAFADISGRMGWFYTYETGWPITAAGLRQGMDIGTPGQAKRITQTRMTSFGIREAYLMPLPSLPPSPLCSGLRVVSSNSPGSVHRLSAQISIYTSGNTIIGEVK